MATIFELLKLKLSSNTSYFNRKTIIEEKGNNGLRRSVFRERDYFGYFKGYELILDNKILACTYN